MKSSVEETIRDASRSPGVYMFKDSKGKILYIGKADSLRDRLPSYLSPSDAKTVKLLEKASSVETILTKSGAEALILEDALVKANQPYYNVLLKDDKRYPYIRITLEEYPAIKITRNVVVDGFRYFGPYTDVKAVRRVVTLVAEIFGVRSCSYDLRRLKRPCIKYSMGKCACPYLVLGKVEYSKRVAGACDFLLGNYNQVKRNLLSQIKALNKSLRFEEAAKLKSTIDSIDSVYQVQDVASTRLLDMDVLGYAFSAGRANIAQLKVRNHKVVALLHHMLKGVYSESAEQSLKAFIKQHYTQGDLIPRLIVVSSVPSDRDLLQMNLADTSSHPVRIVFSMRGAKRRLVDMAVDNSLHQLKQELLERQSSDRLVTTKKFLKLARLPARIEGFDVSNLGARHNVGGMVVFTNGAADKSGYRRFKIRDLTQDDPKSLAQVLERRFNHPEWGLPDLILLDGGKPQLNACLKVIPKGIPVVALAKKNEELYLPGRSNPLKLKKDHPTLLLLQEVRDEAHRFSKAYLKKKTAKAFLAD